eukprot:gnl/MRDRNA2_/MRDRNA2_118233_c0_seq1.p1 gnl/MRDRNA2_/MRDRNA2_118233_c0~~gnl/MRDRNA2_/MRDRNA2_118233_c0_seq1.p1  ORF type:complete len:138 (-),score=43.11 gnl/MRDRNA2_/MRDRNA2_118233_c0_seq1:504-917(-)
MSLDAKGIVEVFRSFDTNGDGMLDREELLYIFQQLIMPGQDPAIHEGECQLILEAADLNGDGMISVEQFVNWAYEYCEEEEEQWADDTKRRIVDAVDQDAVKKAAEAMGKIVDLAARDSMIKMQAALFCTWLIAPLQ